MCGRTRSRGPMHACIALFNLLEKSDGDRGSRDRSPARDAPPKAPDKTQEGWHVLSRAQMESEAAASPEGALDGIHSIERERERCPKALKPSLPSRFGTSFEYGPAAHLSRPSPTLQPRARAPIGPIAGLTPSNREEAAPSINHVPPG
jgi:hypothetical protein